MREGRGICHYAHCIYEGEWRQNFKHGYGKLTYAGKIYPAVVYLDLFTLSTSLPAFSPASVDGTTYEGEFQYDEKSGKGTIIYADGGVYTGKFCENKKNGRGKYISPNGDIYEGGWEDGLFHGQGMYFCVNGDVYEGEYSGGYEHGHGRYTFQGGEYDGEWSHGYRSGQGRLTSSTTGEIYEGEFLNGLQHGYGSVYRINTQTNEEELLYNGIWEEGQCIQQSWDSCLIS